MLYVDGMNGVISHPQTLQWLYTLTSSKVSEETWFWMCVKQFLHKKYMLGYGIDPIPL